jgi:hypothetical protein
MSIPIGSDLTFVNGAKINGLPPATAPGQPATFEQLSGGGGGGSIETIALDFGLIPVSSKVFTFARSGATESQRVMIGVSAKMPAGVDLDELEMDSINVSAFVSAVDTITVLATSSGLLTGQRNFNYQVT